MRYLLLLYNIIALICSSAAQSSMAPGAYIVEMIPTVNDASPPFSAHNTHVQAFHLAATEIKYTIRYNFTNPDIFFGVSLQVENTTKSDEEIRKYFSTKPGVISVTPVWVVDIPTPPDGEESPTVSDLEPFWNPFKPKPTSTSTPMQLMGPFKGGNLSSSLRMGGVDRLHALGIKGKGIRIGIIDTGVDYQHPALGGKFGPGNKIAGGHAYVDNHGNPVDKNDPLTKCPQGGHGTHVAGIIGMQKAAKGFDIDGVAPEASLYMYRIGDCHRGFSDSVLKAFGKAHDDNVDILNLSMGSFFPWDGFQVDIYAEAVKSLTDAGIIVVAALGNSALAGTLKGGCPLYTGSVPAAESNVIAVGSVVNTNFPTVYSANDSVHTIRYASLYPVNITGDADVYFFKDACNVSEWNNVLNTTREQVSKTIFVYQKSVKVPLCLLGRRGFYLTSALYQPAYIMEILANTTNSLNNLTDPYDSSYSPMMAEDIDSLESIQVASVNAADGERLRKAYESSGGYLKYKLSFANVTLISVTSPAGGMIDFSSSFGPVPGSLLLKPQLSAPGGAILSTFPMHTDGRGYTIMSGTSMATPYVTGCFALLKTQFPKANQSELISRLQVTSRPISWAYNSSMLAATPQQGAGLINAYDAIFSSTRISPSELTVQDVSLTEYGRVNITIENIDSQPQVYNFSHVGAGYMNKVGNHFDQLPIFGKAELDPAFYHSNITKITVWPGNSSVVQFAISPPSEVDRELEPLFSGFLVITSLTLNQIFHVPYVGKPY